MDVNAWLVLPHGADANAMLAGVNGRLTACGLAFTPMLAGVNGRLIACGLAITREDARMLERRRVASLAEIERVEFGEPAALAIAEAVAGSPWLSPENVAENLATLQDAFYALRDELPADVSDAEIAEALRGCLDAWGDAAAVASLPADEIMSFSREYVRASESEADGAYRITDDEGRTYSFDPQEWAYDEQADGWDGERWADDGDD